MVNVNQMMVLAQLEKSNIHHSRRRKIYAKQAVKMVEH